MESGQLSDDNFSSNFNINQELITYWEEIAKWAKFLAIVGFVMIGFIVLIGIFAGAAFSHFGGVGGPLPPGLIPLLYLLVGALYFFPVLYLYRFATNLQMALKGSDENLITESFKNLKSCFKFIGVLTIIVLVIYAITILFALLADGVGAYQAYTS